MNKTQRTSTSRKHQNTAPTATRRRWPAAGATARHANDDGQASFPLRRCMHEGLTDLPADSRILAVGCDQAFLALQLAEYSSCVTVLDSAAGEMAQVARRFPDIAFLPHQPSAPLPFAANTFDAIWCCDLLDRVFDPTAALRELERVLTPGGRLLITVPDDGPISHRHAELLQTEEELEHSIPRISPFTRSHLVSLARHHGFERIRTTLSPRLRRGAGGGRHLFLQARKVPGLARGVAVVLAETRCSAGSFVDAVASEGAARAA